MHFSAILLLTSTTLFSHTSSIPISTTNTLLARDEAPISFPSPLLERRQDSVGTCTQNCLLYGCDCDCAEDGTIANGASGGTSDCSPREGGSGGGISQPPNDENDKREIKARVIDLSSPALPAKRFFPAALLERRQFDVGTCTQNCILYGCDCDCAQDGTVANSSGGGSSLCGSSSGGGGGGGYATADTPNPDDPGNPGPPGNAPDNGVNGVSGGSDDDGSGDGGGDGGDD